METFQTYSSHYVPITGVPELEGRIRWGGLTLDEITSQKKSGQKLREESRGKIRAYKRLSPADFFDNITDGPVPAIDEAVFFPRSKGKDLDVGITKDPWDDDDDFSITPSFYVEPSRSQTQDSDNIDSGASVASTGSQTDSSSKKPMIQPPNMLEKSFPKPKQFSIRRVAFSMDERTARDTNHRRQLAQSWAFYGEMDPSSNVILQGSEQDPNDKDGGISIASNQSPIKSTNNTTAQPPRIQRNASPGKTDSPQNPFNQQIDIMRAMVKEERASEEARRRSMAAREREQSLLLERPHRERGIEEASQARSENMKGFLRK